MSMDDEILKQLDAMAEHADNGDVGAQNWLDQLVTFTGIDVLTLDTWKDIAREIRLKLSEDVS